MDNLKTILILIADAWKPSVVSRLVQSEQLPNIQKYFFDQGLWIQECRTVVPSVSLPSHTALLTGALPNKHGILGHRWLRRNSNSPRCYLGLHRHDPNQDINPRIKTIFELVHPAPSISICSPIYRGASKNVSLKNLRDTNILKHLMHHLDAGRNYKVIVAWLPQTDLLSHTHGCESERVIQNTKTVDFFIGQLFAFLDRKRLLDKYVIVLTSDHGHRNVSKHLNPLQLFQKAARNVNHHSILDIFQEPQKKSLHLFLNGQASAYIYSVKNSPHKLKLVSEHLISYEGIRACLLRDTKDIIAKDSISDDYLDLAQKFLLSENAPDLLIFSENEYDFSTGLRLGFRLGYHKSTHGGISDAEMTIFSVIWDSSLKGQIIKSANITDILPTVLDLAGYNDPIQQDGVSLIYQLGGNK